MSKRILVVDDEPDLVRAMQIRLKMAGYQSIVAYDGEEALRKAREEKPDLIMLDLMMPKIDGFKVCAMLKADPAYSSIPVIVLTASAQEADEKFCLQAGADAFITKPFQHEDVIAKVRELLHE